MSRGPTPWRRWRESSRPGSSAGFFRAAAPRRSPPAPPPKHSSERRSGTAEARGRQFAVVEGEDRADVVRRVGAPFGPDRFMVRLDPVSLFQGLADLAE